MNKLKAILIGLFFLYFIPSMHALTPFTLTGVKSYYPVVDFNTEKLSTQYKDEILKMLIDKSTALGIETENFSSRSLAFLISYINVGDDLALKIELMLGENATRLDTKENIFVISYMYSRIFLPEDLDYELMENIEAILEIFEEQYIEDNL